MSVADVEMRSSAKRPTLDVDSDTDPAWMPAFSAMLDSKLDTKVDGFERTIGQVFGLHQTLLDIHDAELDSQRQLLEDLKTEVSLLRKGSTDSVRMESGMSSDSACTVESLTLADVVPAECACARLGSVLALVPCGKLIAWSTRNCPKSCCSPCCRRA